MSRHRGQAEIIGGVIVIAVLLLALTAVYFTLIGTQTTVIDVYSKRTNFESERSAEKLTVIYDHPRGACKIINTGAVDIYVARIWVNEGDFCNPPCINIPKNIPVGENVVVPRDIAPSYIVTTRGNVFPIKAECEKQVAEHIYSIYGAPPYPSENIIATKRLTYEEACIVVNVTGVTGINFGLLYNNGTWLYHKCDVNDKNTYGWKVLGKILNAPNDLDGNGVNETIISSNVPDNPSNITVKQTKCTINIQFYNLTQILNITDVVTVYYKFLLAVGVKAQPFDIPLQVYVSLVESIEGGKFFTSPGSTQVASVSKKDVNVFILTGFVAFPRYFFNLTPGEIYSVIITLEVDLREKPASIEVVQVDLEFIAISGAEVLWKELKPS